MFDTLTGLIGLPISDDRIIAFIEKNGFKYPKKPTISNRSTDTTYWVENKKLGFDLLFSAQVFLDNYPLIAGDRKGIFIPILSSVRWHNNKSKTRFPHDLDFSFKFDALKNILGEPTLKSSDIARVWINDDGSESFYRWYLPVDAEKDIYWGLQYDDDDSIRDFSLGLPYDMPVLEFYDKFMSENFATFSKATGFYRTAKLMFLQWAIERDLLKLDTEKAKIATAIKERKAPITDMIKALDRGYVLEDDFSAENSFARIYTHNLSGFNILYTQDVAYTYLQDATLRENYFGEDARKVLSTFMYNEENYQIVKGIIDNRLAEYKSHKFSKSKQLA